MNKFKIATIMLQKIRPRMYDPNWVKALELIKTLNKKTVTNRDLKEKHFCHLVDKIYEQEEQNEREKKDSESTSKDPQEKM